MKSKMYFPWMLLALFCTSVEAAMTEAECIDALATNSELAPLKDKVALGRVETQTFSMKTNTSRATVFDKPLIIKWVEAKKECTKQNPSLDKLPPSLRTLLDQLWVQIEATALNLYEGKITFGEFAQQREAMNFEYKKKVSDEMARLKDAQQQSQAAMQAQAQSAAKAKMEAAAISCETARRNVDTLCGKQGNVTINVGPNGNVAAPQNGPNSGMSSFLCGYWQGAMIKACQ